MRGTRNRTLAAVAMAGVLALAGCAKDSGGTGGDTAAPADQGAQGCVTAPKPPAAAPAAQSQAQDSEKVDASKLKVGLAYDVGGRGDASFNDAAAAGADKAKAELGVPAISESTATGTESEDSKQQRLNQMATEGFNPIIAVGFAYADSIKAVAPKFPDTKFAIVDDDSVQAPNVTPLVFAEEQGSFLAGVAAVYKSKSCHVGFVGGVDTPLIQKFEAGFLQGVKAASSKAKIEDEYLTPAGDISGFNDPGKGNIKAAAQINKGADVIYHAAGASGKGVFEAAKSSGKALAIGVDSDQYNQKTVENAKDVIITSMIKRVDVAVFDFIKAVAKGDTTTLPKRFDLKVDGVGYATSGGKVDDIKDVLEGYKAQIISGAITVTDKPQK
ncbi:BMP family ABC transporter substrate-binding protein [Amycolatopsis magusensis]|uniref:Basic membrane protein A n=2 Tax=Amycolatopsis magusensis TaxID=882444 RepID=A0ABS4PMI3_9PSEU|nr:BMP family ABC transporter substrate-binding protein [Amycolatopsis magusensis]MBP2180631.1 basic membrane protein A [Amycolatopsis magusensis]MDI5980488.1 BMP family ABC transporter substrate-binding protein [Amycolatopsis magusensis]